MNSFRAKEKYLPFILIIISLGVYLSTVCPTVYVGDSGELTAAAFSLGIPHSSGYPFYALIGKLFCLVPIGNVGFRMNLMSSFFSLLTLWLIYSLTMRITSSALSSLAGGLILAFSPLFWSQSLYAEVYSLHTFFVALLTKLLWRWDEKKRTHSLIIFVFITGISFGNHLQTVMLAPAVLFIIISGNKEALLNVRNIMLLTLFFILALSLYLYLPIRTGAGAAIHWGDPDNLDRFLTHVTARSHRSGYVLNMTMSEYLIRAKESLKIIADQLGVLIVFSVWGWMKLTSVRWRIFFLLLIIFDLFYTVCLNTIALEVTPFNLSTCIVLAILAANGIACALSTIKGFSRISASTQKIVKMGVCAASVIPLFVNFSLCDQSINYTGYEHAVNIFRSLEPGNTMFMDGDNNIFPVVYGRLVERMGEDVTIFDRYNLLFKWSLDGHVFSFYGKWEEFRSAVEKRIIKMKAPQGVYFAVFNPHMISVPDQYQVIPHGILRRVVQDRSILKKDLYKNVWYYYSMESFSADFDRDYMNREVCSNFWFDRGRHLFLVGQYDLGLKNIRLASKIGYNDTGIHSDIAVFLTDQGFFEEARQEMEKASRYYIDLSGVYNNWGYYYHKFGDYPNAISSFRKAIELRHRNSGYHKNLALSLYEAGKKEEALLALKKSLEINKDQPGIHRFIAENL
ncbi:MAG: DUF2723 domain-containing protein [Pseudomonadota bacterium]